MWHEHTSASKLLRDTVLVDWSYRVPAQRSMTLQPSMGGPCDIEADLADGFYQCHQTTPNRSTLPASALATSLLSIRVQINFTELFSDEPEEDPLLSEPLATLNAAYIYVGLVVDKFDPFTSGTRPIPLFPGTNMLSVVERVARQSIKESSLAILGFEVSRVSRMQPHAN